MADQYDAVMIGAGHNGLTCACYLVKAGLKVLVLEQYIRIGGCVTTEEITLPSFKSDLHATGYQYANLSPTPRELNLSRYGFELIRPDPCFAHPFADGRYVSVSRSLEKSMKSIEKYSKRDAQAWKHLHEAYLAAKQNIVNATFSPPVPLAAQIALLERGPGLDAYRSSLQSLRSWCDEWFEAEETKILIGSWGGHSRSPDDAGGASSGYLLASLCQDAEAGNNLVKGGSVQLALALAKYLEAHGGEIITGAKVSQIVIKEGRAVAVKLQDGRQIPVRRLVAASVDPRQLFLELIGEEHLDPNIVKKIRRYEWGDPGFTIYLALDGIPHYKADPEARHSAYVHITPSLDHLAKAFQESRSGKMPAEPLIILIQEYLDSTRMPNGKGVLKIGVKPVPYEIKGDATGEIDGRSWDEAKEQYADYLLDILADNYIPDIKKIILKRVVNSPVDLERRLLTPVQGTWGHQGATLPYQLGSMRPIPECGSYRTPVQNIYQCGAGTHPGPGVSMAPGRNAAQVILTDLGLDFKRIAGG